MNKGLAFRSAVTLLAFGCVVYIIFLAAPGRFSFDWQIIDSHTLVVEPRTEGLLAPGLRAGDRIDLRDQNLRTRAALYAETLPGESYVLHIERDGSALTVPATKSLPRETDGDVLYAAYLLLVLLLGLTTLWWGRDWTAWGLSVFAIGTILNYVLYVIPLPPVAGFIAIVVNQSLVLPVFIAGLYVAAFSLASPGLTDRRRLLCHLCLGLVLAAVAVMVTLQTVRFVAFGDATLVQSGLPSALFAFSIFIPIAVLFAAYPRVDAARRLRLRWIAFSLLLFLGATAWNNLADLGDALSTRGVIRQAIWWSAVLSGLAGLLYGVLRKRVVAMSFAINRALVYGLIAAFVIGIFAVLTALIENTAIGRDAGLALTVAVSVGVGFVLEAMRDRINVLVERLFFRQKYEAEAALRRFARQCAYIESPERLLDQAEEEIHRHIQPGSSAFYGASENGYKRIRERGEANYPERIDIDDRAFVSMRADREAVDLRDVRSALGNEGFAFPMAVRGELGGALVCGPRTEEYTGDERKLLADLAQQVGTALFALRARENDALVRAVASGTIDLATARQRAKAVHAGR